MKNKEVRKHHTYDLKYGTVDVTIEVKDLSTYKDKNVRFELKVSKTDPHFAGWVEGEMVKIPVTDKDTIGDFKLPPAASELSHGRIQDGINAFLDAMYA